MTLYDALYDLFESSSNVQGREFRTRKYKNYINILRSLELVILKIDEMDTVDQWEVNIFKHGIYLLKALTFDVHRPHYIAANADLINDLFRFGHHYIDSYTKEKESFINLSCIEKQPIEFS